MPCKSVVSYLAIFSEFILDNFDYQTQVDTICTDYTQIKAFYWINHIVLVEKLTDIGVCGDFWFII